MDNGGHQIRAEKPPADVDFMYERVSHGHRTGEPIRGCGIAVDVVQKDGRSNAAFIRHPLHLDVSRIKASHVADLQKPAPKGHLSIHHLQCFSGTGCKWLFA